MLVTTTSTIQGAEVQQYYGIVHGETILGANLFRDIAASIRDIFGGRSSSYEEVLQKAQTTAQEEMIKRAQMLGANAVIGVKFDYTTVGAQSSMLMVACTGTAVRISHQ